MNEREYLRLKAEAEAEYRRKLEAIEVVWKLSGGAQRNDSEGSGATTGKGFLLKAVRNALEDMRGEFTIHDIENWIRRNNPTLAATIRRPSLSSTLKRLAKDGVIGLVSTGSGRRASKYRRGSVPAT